MTARAWPSIAITMLLSTLLPRPSLGEKYSKRIHDMQGVVVPARVLPQPKVRKDEDSYPGPRLTLDEFIANRQSRIQKVIDRQIAQLRRLIKLASPDDPKLPDYWFRLGELCAEKFRYFEHRARSLDEAIWKAEHGEDGSGAQLQRREQKGAEDKAQEFLRTAITQLASAAKHPRYERMDEVLYRLGYLLRSANRSDASREMFHRLLKEFPQSSHVPDAYLAFADDFFAKGDMRHALDFYTKVTQFPASPVYGFALYKTAWTRSNLDDHAGALETLVQLLGDCQAGRIGKAQRASLEKEARRDLVTFYARTPRADPDRAANFFRRVAGIQAPALLQALAEAYWLEGMASTSTRVYRKLMALEPRSPSLCAWQDKVLRNTLSAGTESEQVQELTRLGTAYRHLQNLGQAKPEVVTECRGRYHDAARELAFVLHKQAQRTKQLPTYQLAAAAYREFLSAFESEPASAEVAFYYAECLWQIAAQSSSDTSSWSSAAEQYTKVIHLDDRSPYVKEAAYAAVLAWQNALYDNSAGPPERGASHPLRLDRQ